MEKIARLAWIVTVLATVALAQNLDKIGATVVHLYKPNVGSGTGFFVGDGTTIFLVTADHVASIMKSDFRATLLADHDTPFDVSSEELTGASNVTWVFHGIEDVAVAVIHPKENVMSRMAGHVLRREQVSTGTDAPSRERPLTTFGFPLDLGVAGHFSPITRDSAPASGLITLRRFDNHQPATFYLLQDPSVAGFSGGPVFLVDKPFASSSGGLVLPRKEYAGQPASIWCVGIVHGTIGDETGGKMAAVTPSKYILETMDKATSPSAPR